MPQRRVYTIAILCTGAWRIGRLNGFPSPLLPSTAENRTILINNPSVISSIETEHTALSSACENRRVFKSEEN